MRRLKQQLDSAVVFERGVHLNADQVRELNEWLDSLTMWTETVRPRSQYGRGRDDREGDVISPK